MRSRGLGYFEGDWATSTETRRGEVCRDTDAGANPNSMFVPDVELNLITIILKSNNLDGVIPFIL